MKRKQPDLFNEDGTDPESEWVGMPEFHQHKVEPFSAMTIRFETEQDLNDFAELIGQKLTPKTKSIWHPYKPHCSAIRKYYVYEP